PITEAMVRLRRALVLVLSAIAVLAAASPDVALARGKKHHETGVASFYGREWQGHRTASGEPVGPNAFTAAHPTLPFGTRIRVTNLENGRHVVVRINDRGPFAHDRVLDLSRAAARKLDFIAAGTARVRIDVLKSRAVAASVE